MQTSPLPIQVSGASAGPAPARANPASPDGTPQFSQALKRELDQRQNQAAAAPQAQAKPAAPAKAQGPAKAAQAEPEQQAAQPEGKPDAAAVEDEAIAQTAEAVAAAPLAEMPVADMLALVASFNQPLQSAAVAAQEATELPGSTAQTPAAAAAAGLAQLPQAGAVLQPAADSAATTALAAAALPSSAQGDRGSAADAATGAEPVVLDSRQPAASAQPAVQAKAQPEPSQFASLLARESADQVAIKDTQAAAAPVSGPLQQASLALAQAAGGVASDKIAARVGTPGWDNQVAQKIVWMVAGKEQSAALTLNPPDMGPLQVVLNVTNDQASVTFSSAQPEVRQALENAMPKLREMMSESGISLGNATVNAGMPDQRQAQGEQQRGASSQGGQPSANGSAAEAAERHAARPGARGERQGLVDTFA